MFLVNKEGDRAYNLDNAEHLYAGYDGACICAFFMDDREVAVIADFDTYKEARAEFDRIIEALERGAGVYRIRSGE